ncbi:hypothetical protein CKO23_16375 [Thiocystis violacea]|nr:hypothetical protein [Thiocystis violacea]
MLIGLSFTRRAIQREAAIFVAINVLMMTNVFMVINALHEAHSGRLPVLALGLSSPRGGC